jgi:hypothetical protein
MFFKLKTYGTFFNSKQHLKDKHGNKLEYIIPHKGNSLAKIFGVMESNRESYSIADYSVSQTTLDQVFINFAKSQRGKETDDEDEETKGEKDDEEYKNEMDSDRKIVDEIRVDIPNEDMINTNKADIPTFESIKNHFNSLKKSRHIRKTSSAKSQQSIKSNKSLNKKAASINENSGGFSNLAYEIEFKNSDECELPMQESSQDLTTSINEDGEYFSRC